MPVSRLTGYGLPLKRKLIGSGTSLSRLGNVGIPVDGRRGWTSGLL